MGSGDDTEWYRGSAFNQGKYSSSHISKLSFNSSRSQREDPGKMIQTGYSAGQRSKPAFNWVRNLERKNELTPEFLASADYQTSCLFALGWNICRAQMPREVMDGWVGWLENSKLPRMDAGVQMTGKRGDYHVRIGEYTATFHDAELAPPTGLLNQNYARSAHFFSGAKHIYQVVPTIH